MKVARARTAILAVAACVLMTTDARAQFGVPFARYRTFQTPHFVLTFETELEDYARRAAANAEAAHAVLTRAYGSTPRGKIRLVIVDQGDIFNGAAMTLPTNRVIMFAHTPVEGDLFYSDDPIELLATHELAHVFHLDEARRGWRLLRWVFGRSELTFPHLFDGSALVEGLATFYESRLTSSGRVRGSRFDEVLRAAVLETEGPKVDEAEADPGAWPRDRHYVFGSLFLDHLATQYGADTPPSWMRRRAGSFGSIVSRGAGVGDLLGGKTVSRAWSDWIEAERDDAVRLRERLRAEPPGLAATRRVCDVAHYTAFPRVSPNGASIAFLATDEGRRPLGLYVADLDRCVSRRVARVDSAHAFGWTPDGGSIVFSQLAMVDNARLIADLYRVEIATGAISRLTTRARLASPDVHPNGQSLVAVQYDRQRSRLVKLDTLSGGITPLTEFSTDVAWGPARWSPDGTELAALRFTRGTSFDLVLLSADGRQLRSLTDDRALEGIPEWDANAPDGIRRLFFTSDRTGIRELYVLELEGESNPRLYLTARVATGLHELAVVPANPARATRAPGVASPRTSMVAIVTHADGRHLERFEIDRDGWIAAPPTVAEYAQRPSAPEAPPVETTAPASYVAARDLFPTGWSPVFETVEGLGAFAGGAASAVDVIGRHGWHATATYGPGGRTIGSASYVYRRFLRAQLFGQVSSTWRLEERIESTAGSRLLRLERKRSASLGVLFPWITLRRTAQFETSLRVEDRHREDTGDMAAVSVADPLRQDPTLVGGAVALRFGHVQAGSRSISLQDGVRFSVSSDYLKATAGDRWRAGWDVAASVYRSLPSWTKAGRPVVAATGRIAEQRGPAAGRLTAGGVGSAAFLELDRSGFEARGYPPGLIAANALWGARGEMRLPIARVSRGLGALPLYLRALSGTVFVDSVGAARRADMLGSPQLLSTGAELSTDVSLFSFMSLRIRTGMGVPLKRLGPVTRGETRFYAAAGTTF